MELCGILWTPLQSWRFELEMFPRRLSCGHPYRVGDSNCTFFQVGYPVDIPTELAHLVATRVFVAVTVLRILLSAN